MRIKGWIAVAALALAACAADAPPPPPPSENVMVGLATKEESLAARAEPQRAHAGDLAVSVIGTPFLWIVKGVACVATVAIAAPAGAVLALRPDIYRQEAPYLGDSVAASCGPPWVLSPAPETG
jgi:hypothetical protein